MASLHPSHGARLVLRREALDDAEVRYRVSVYEPGDVVHEGEARIRCGDDEAVAVDLGGWRSTPPDWTLVFLERLLKGLPKKHAGDASWPRRLTRWRAAR
ncbi:MAG TPA: hypothetical protein RMH99_12585 [Sandaracinaceae bacterium LLY-WYZ-13_1]|nr:hypothetical protein [Sandaracinaceae bacterium LLY-WYZ-13_1]